MYRFRFASCEAPPCNNAAHARPLFLVQEGKRSTQAVEGGRMNHDVK